jgi:hypothetical protein
MRRLVFGHLDVSEAARQTLDPGVTRWGGHVPSAVEAGIVLLRAGDADHRDLAVQPHRVSPPRPAGGSAGACTVRDGSRT